MPLPNTLTFYYVLCVPTSDSKCFSKFMNLRNISNDKSLMSMLRSYSFQSVLINQCCTEYE